MIDPQEHAGRFAGEDVYVTGSGATLNHLDPAFFTGKRVVSTNHGVMMALDSVDYLVTKYHHHAYEYLLAYPGIPVVVTKHALGNMYREPIDPAAPFIVLEHNDNPGDLFNGTQFPPPGQFVASWSTITTAMHWAAHLGARNIIMVGHDCGVLGGRGRIDRYRDESALPTDPAGEMGDIAFWRGFDLQSRIVKDLLLERYEGLRNVVSILPFINPNMEGHRWQSAAGVLNG